MEIRSFCNPDYHDGERVPADWQVSWGKKSDRTLMDNKTYFACDRHLFVAIMFARYKTGNRQKNFTIIPVNVGHDKEDAQ